MHFRRDREPEMTKSAPPLGHFITRTQLQILRCLVDEGCYVDARLMLAQWCSRRPRMPTQAEEGQMRDG